jgi:hypothetical protein
MSISESGDQSMSVLSDQENLQKKSSDEDVFKDILKEESELEMNERYPNDAYADLMTLVLKHKLSNTTSNAIIKFFNKHANLTSSPLPKSIEQGHKHMDNMNIPTLSFTKTSIINYNDHEYFLHHRSLINCVKNILSIPDISQSFALTFNKLEVIMSVM